MEKPTLRVTKWLADIPVERTARNVLRCRSRRRGLAVARTARSVRSDGSPSLKCTVRRCIPKRD